MYISILYTYYSSPVVFLAPERHKLSFLHTSSRDVWGKDKPRFHCFWWYVHGNNTSKVVCLFVKKTNGGAGRKVFLRKPLIVLSTGVVQRESTCDLGGEVLLGCAGSLRDCVWLLRICLCVGSVAADPIPRLAHSLSPVCCAFPSI